MTMTPENIGNTPEPQDPETIQAALAADEDDDGELTAPHAPRRPQRDLRYKQGIDLVSTDIVQVERDVLRAAVTILRRDIVEREVWAVEVVDLYSGYGGLTLPVEALGHLLEAFSRHRCDVTRFLHGKDQEKDAALEAATTIGVPFDRLERVLFALTDKVDSLNNGYELELGAYKRAARVAQTVTDIIEVLAAYERDVLIPRGPEKQQAG